MAKTLLQLINEVGKNVRRSTGSTYTTINQDGDAVFINQAINEAKRMVEDGWKWDVLQKTITFPSVADTATYDTSSLSVVDSDPDVTTDRSFALLDSSGRLQGWDVTSGNEFRLRRVPRDYAEHISRVNSISVARPVLVSVYPNGSGLTVHFPYAPAGVRNYAFQFQVPQADLTSASTELLIPAAPVVLAATALVVEERGEELGLDSARWWEQFENALGGAVSRDSTADDFSLVRV